MSTSLVSLRNITGRCRVTPSKHTYAAGAALVDTKVLPRIATNCPMGTKTTARPNHRYVSSKNVIAIITLISQYKEYIRGLKIVGYNVQDEQAFSGEFLQDLGTLFPGFACITEAHSNGGSSKCVKVGTQLGGSVLYASAEDSHKDVERFLPASMWGTYYVDPSLRPYQGLYNTSGCRLSSFLSIDTFEDAANYLLPLTEIDESCILVVCPPAAYTTASIPDKRSVRTALRLKHMRDYVYLSVTTGGVCYQCAFLSRLLKEGGNAPGATIHADCNVSHRFLE